MIRIGDGTKPGRLTPNNGQKTLDYRSSPGMDERRRRRNREGRGELTRLNRWRRRWRNRCLPPGPAQAGPGCQAATVAEGRRETKTRAPRWRKCASWMQGGPTNGIRKPATVRVAGWRPDEGREGGNLCNIHHIFTASRHTNAVLYYKTFNPMSSRICSTFILNQAAFTCSV